MSVNKEKWIDLFCLVQRIDEDNGMISLIYDTDIPHRVHSQTYLLRRAVREVGFKIKQVITYGDSNCVPDMLEYYTNIPQALWDTKWKFYQEWVQEAYEFYNTADSDSECDEENESEETDPVA
jgi:hypothetical protein